MTFFIIFICALLFIGGLEYMFRMESDDSDDAFFLLIIVGLILLVSRGSKSPADAKELCEIA